MIDNKKRFFSYCKRLGFNDNDIQKMFKLVAINDGKINEVMIRGHFRIGWASSVHIAEEMSSCHVAILEDKIPGGIKRLPKEDVLGWWKEKE